MAGKLDIQQGVVELQHGSGGRATATLLQELFLPAFANPILAAGNDQATLPQFQNRLAITTDSHVIYPLFFPGGNIGSLAVHGTINDLAVGGARPKHLAANFILEEGFPLADLQRIVNHMAEAAIDAGVTVVTGDTKVVERGKGDGVYITTTGVGILDSDTILGADRIRAGDAILVNGTLGDHGIAVMAARPDSGLVTELQSDSQSLHRLTAAMLQACPSIHCMRDPTRGGLAAALNELAHQARVGMRIEESHLPVTAEVRAACELLGFDPVNIANEGKLIAFCSQQHAPALLAAIREHPQGKEAAIIGTVVEDPSCKVSMRTRFGGTRLLEWKWGDPLPRIC